MIFKHVLGEINFKATGDNYLKFLNMIRDSTFKCINLYSKSNDVYGKIYGNKFDELLLIAKQNYMEIEIIKKNGIVYKILPYKKRFGVILGVIFSVAIILFLSNTALKICIIGCDDALSENVLSVLQLNGIKIGKFIPNMDFDQAERNLLTDLKDVSWVSIRSSGGIITVNLSQVDKKPDMIPRRLPCNIISTKNAQIKNVQVYAGQLVVLLGDSVKKGELLISGFVEDKNGKYTYYHAQGKIIGEFEEEIVFTQPLLENVKIVSEKTQKRNYFNFFSCKIPLFIGGKPSGEFKLSERTNDFSLFTLKLPLGITHSRYQPYEIKEFSYSMEEAKQKIEQKIQKYESNFQNDFEIINKKITESITEFEITYRVKYTLQGDICESSEILVKK